MRPFTPLLLPLATLTAFAAFPPLRAQQTPLPGPTYDERDIQVVRRGDKPPSSLGAKLAVVVGVNRYAKLSPLTYPEKDAKDLTTALTGLGFSVRTLTLDSQEPPFHAESILSVIAEVCRDADPTDTVLIALSGHGFSESGGKDGYFCAHYTDPQKLSATGLSLDEVRRRLVASPAKQRMLIVDACRNVPGEKGASKRLEISEAFRAEGLGVLFSTAPGMVSQEPADGAVLMDALGRRIENGVFTHYLLRGLEGEADSNGDGWLTFRELAYHTWREVKGKTQNKQKPYLDWVGEAGGDFLLRQVPVRAVAVANAPEEAPPVVPAAAPVSADAQPAPLDVTAGVYAPRTGPERDRNPWRRNIDAGLQWLKNHQDDDGKWDCDCFDKHDDPSSDVRDGLGNATKDVGVTSLALLAFLGDGSTIRSGPYAPVIKKGVSWLRKQQDSATGLFGQAASHDFIYDHAIATYAMCEASGLSGYLSLRDVAQGGINYLESHRNPYSVWRYQPRDNDNDTSVTGWCIMAYESGEFFKLAVKEEALKLCAQWLDQVSDPSGLHGYTKQGELSARKGSEHAAEYPVDKGAAMTAVGLFCRFLLNQDPKETPVMTAAADLILSKPPIWDESAGTIDHYYWYHATHALFQMGGTHWTTWQKALEGAVVDNQRLDKAQKNLYGSWDPKCAWGEDGGRVYSTAILVLTLEAPHRFARFRP